MASTCINLRSTLWLHAGCKRFGGCVYVLQSMDVSVYSRCHLTDLLVGSLSLSLSLSLCLCVSICELCYTNSLNFEIGTTRTNTVYIHI